MSSAPGSTGSTRLNSLDGLRGVAALVVVFYHLSLVARPFLDTGRTGDAWWWLTETPLKVFTLGTESVLVFFVLSGVVVTLPALRGTFRWSGYYFSRLLRLYLPVWGALVVATALIVALPRTLSAVTAGSWTARANATEVTVPHLFAEASLWMHSYEINNVLWSLRWELIFSLALPLFVGVAVALRRWWVGAALGAAALTVSGRVLDSDALVYLPVFFLGTLLAIRLPEVQQWAVRRSSWVWVGLSTGSLVLLMASFLARSVISPGSGINSFLWGCAGIGAVGLVVTAIGSPGWVRVLSRRVPQWLGRISFSLYLVHVPVIATVAFVVGDANWVTVVVLSVPLSVLTGWLFYLGVERPSHRLARKVNRVFAARRQSVPSPTVG